MDESKPLEEIRNKEHPPWYGNVQFEDEKESHVDFLGESEGSLPQPHDSFPDAGGAIHDFWSMSGSFIYRHHVEPRVKLHSPREESFHIPLKYLDVTRDQNFTRNFFILRTRNSKKPSTSLSSPTWHAHIARVLVCLGALFFSSLARLPRDSPAKSGLSGERWEVSPTNPHPTFPTGT